MKSVQHLLGLNFQLVEKLQRIKEVKNCLATAIFYSKKKKREKPQSFWLNLITQSTSRY